MLNLDTDVRAALTERIIQHLEEFVPNSLASLRGSLTDGRTDGRADAYSDIDLLWEVPGVLFPACLVKLPEVLALVAPLESFRSDPDYQNSAQHRLIFVRFEGLPLFWRVDLAVVAISLDGTEMSDENEATPLDYRNWSWSESALANCVAALKNHLRNNDAEALALLIRAYARIDLPFPQDKDVPALVLELANYLEKHEPQIAGLAQRVRALTGEVFS